MTACASIRAKSDGKEAIFEWQAFDGDDSFRDFHIEIVSETKTERFTFGGCAIWALRKSARFFRGEIDQASFAFRFPDVRTFDLTHVGNGFLLQIRLEDARRSEEFRFNDPSLVFGDEFLKAYEKS